MQRLTKALLLDANVLIDYQKSDISILSLVNQHLGTVRVLTPTLEEVDGLDISYCEELGIRMIEPDMHHLIQAATSRGRLSFHDHLCLLVSAASGSVCVTNDRTLRRACTEGEADVMWGLELMTELVRGGVMQAEDAVDVAIKIHICNPVHISAALIEHFTQVVTEIEKKLAGS